MKACSQTPGPTTIEPPAVCALQPQLCHNEGNHPLYSTPTCFSPNPPLPHHKYTPSQNIDRPLCVHSLIQGRNTSNIGTRSTDYKSRFQELVNSFFERVALEMNRILMASSMWGPPVGPCTLRLHSDVHECRTQPELST